MPQGVNIERTWNGPEIIALAGDALAAGIIKIADQAVEYGKENAVVLSGTLQRSVHSAEANYDGSGDYDTARDSDLSNVSEASVVGPLEFSVEVGSWLPYACVVEVGYHEQFITPAVSMVSGEFSNAVMLAEFEARGLR